MYAKKFIIRILSKMGLAYDWNDGFYIKFELAGFATVGLEHKNE